MKNLKKVYTKNRKHYPSVETKYSVLVEHNKSAAIYVDGVEVNKFKMGDYAEYNSWNLIYTGPITKITDKTVQITAYPNSRNAKRHNLSMETFCWRNEGFDVDEVRELNIETSYYI